ncbi:MAG: disulfide bond formation protein B [bacterium]|nr:disulfide bond formation protein B [bacterium]
MVENINLLLPDLVLFSHVVFVVLFLALIFRHSWGAGLQVFIGKHATTLACLISLAALLGSLFYSEIMGFEPCVLCWWQRVFLYPLVIIFAVAVWKKPARPDARLNDTVGQDSGRSGGTTSAFLYAVPFALATALLAAYHSYVYLGGTSILPCTAVGSVCSKIYVMTFGYITIPMMSLTIALYILLLAWANKIYNSENNNA